MKNRIFNSLCHNAGGQSSHNIDIGLEAARGQRIDGITVVHGVNGADGACIPVLGKCSDFIEL